jgi:hypothetical protein
LRAILDRAPRPPDPLARRERLQTGGGSLEGSRRHRHECRDEFKDGKEYTRRHITAASSICSRLLPTARASDRPAPGNNAEMAVPSDRVLTDPHDPFPAARRPGAARNR